MGTATSLSDTEDRGNKPFSKTPFSAQKKPDLWTQKGTVKAVILFPRFDVAIFTSNVAPHPKEFDKELYRLRNKIERFFCPLKSSFRRIVTRYEQTSRNFLAMIKLASVRLWLEFYEYAA